MKCVPNRINKASLPPNLHQLLSAIFSKNQNLMDHIILRAVLFTLYKVATKNLHLVTISPAGCQKAT